jgi:hypothetical protein
MSDTPATNLDLLADALSLTVPVRIVELAGLTDNQRYARLSRLAEIVGTRGDSLQWRSKTATHGQAFAAFSDALALAAYEPGGITWRGHHWCTTPHPQRSRRRPTSLERAA